LVIKTKKGFKIQLYCLKICEFQEKNLNWAPELLDLLHRLMGMTKHDFNSCFLNLYRHGHDMCGWHADVHPQLGRNPPVASVSLGATRVIEFRKKSGPPNFIRFPLLPGSLLIMEGATQVCHQTNPDF
jgi:alkylated DNA repair dioxygenase AlkB